MDNQTEISHGIFPMTRSCGHHEDVNLWRLEINLEERLEDSRNSPCWKCLEINRLISGKIDKLYKSFTWQETAEHLYKIGTREYHFNSDYVQNQPSFKVDLYEYQTKVEYVKNLIHLMEMGAII